LHPGRLRAAVRETLTKKAGAERIASVFAEAGGPKAAIDALEELIEEGLAGPTERAGNSAG
jgi:UDP:flavonoid glycosyltransferase YjiC (YdhE family)